MKIVKGTWLLCVAHAVEALRNDEEPIDGERKFSDLLSCCCIQVYDFVMIPSHMEHVIVLCTLALAPTSVTLFTSSVPILAHGLAPS
jgi:hypothetical protein